ncbi:MAG: ribosome assembly RNA-binding protein YhbY [Steroidobacteraceae bacterium]
MELTEKQRRHLCGLAHPLKPLVMIGNAGLTDAVVHETDRALRDHELVKVRVGGKDRAERDAFIALLGQRSASAVVTRIGHVAVLYRAHKKLPRIVIPD